MKDEDGRRRVEPAQASQVIRGGPGDAELVEMYRRMVTIRRFEETAFDVYRRGWMPGLAHLSDGQEATPVGVCGALREDDTITSTHRGHGHIIAKGGLVEPMVAEVMGKVSG